MLQSLQQIGKEIGRDIARGWESLTDGWRELLSRSANALTQYTRKYVRGEKRHDGTYVDGAYHVRQCAYGAFERAVPLPHHVHADRADAQFRNGVLVVRLPKAPEATPRRISIQ